MFWKQTLAGLVVGAVLAGPAAAMVDTDILDYEIRLPQSQIAPVYSNPDEGQALQLLPALADFRSAEGASWRILQWNDRLATPAALAGPGIPLVGSAASEPVIRASVEAFVARNAEMLHADPRSLRISDVINIGGDRTHVILTQYLDGMEVIFGRVDVALWEGKVVLTGSEFFEDVAVNRYPLVDAGTAGRFAHIGIPEHASDAVEGSPRLVVLPLFTDTGIDYHLAWEIFLRTQDPENVWRTYVDAHDGAVLWRESGYQFYEINGTVTGYLEENYNEWYDYPLEDLRVRAGGTYNGYTNEAGEFTITVPNNIDYSNVAELYGYFCNANNSAGADAEIEIYGGPGDAIDFYFDNTNATPAENCVFYHTNVVHDWIKDLDPTFDDLDYAMGASVNITSGTCNAWWNGSAMFFYGAGDGCNNIGRISEVVYHEYGHGISSKYYGGGGPTSSGLAEAFSDIASYCIHPNAEVGEYFYTNGGYVRTGENLRQYPGTECGGEVHCLGEIAMGAMWKVRKFMTQKYGDSVGEVYDPLHINAIKTRPYSQPSYLSRLLLENDDDGDLTNGTPDWYEICDGFAMHNLPCPDLQVYVTVTSDPLDDQEQEGPYDVLATAVATGCVISDVDLYYTTDDIGGEPTWLTIPMTPTANPDEFGGAIPEPGCGELVSYYIRGESVSGEVGTAPHLAPYRDIYQFATGPYAVTITDDLEADQGWTLGWDGDNATQGLWERADPVGKHSDTFGDTQPEDDHTDSGSLCFVTDPRGGAWSSYDVDAGVTSVVSPTFDWSTRSGVASIQFWSFMFDYQPTDDSLRCAISNDDGATWMDIQKQYGMGNNQWTHQKVYFTDDLIEYTNKMRIRFQMEDINSFTTCAEAAIDDIEIRVNNCFAEDVDDSPLPATFAVEQNRPNPFNPSTAIRFALPSSGRVEVNVFDAAGRKVRTLLDGAHEAGYHTVVWDGRDDQDRAAGSGVYYYTVKFADEETGHKMILLK